MANGVKTFESIFSAENLYSKVEMLYSILDNIVKVWKDDKNKSDLIKMIEKDAVTLEKLCEKIKQNASKSEIDGGNFTLDKAAKYLSEEEQNDINRIFYNYETIEVLDQSKADSFSKKLMVQGIPHTTFEIFKPVTDNEGKIIYGSNGEMITEPMTILLTNKEYLEQIQMHDYDSILKKAVRLENVSNTKEQRFGEKMLKDYERNSDSFNTALEIPANFNMAEFQNKMAFANKIYARKEFGGKSYIVVPYGDKAFATAIMQEVLLETNATILGKMSVLESMSNKKTKATLQNSFDTQKSDEYIYIFNGSNANDKSYIEIPKNGDATIYTYFPNKEGNKFVKESKQVKFDGDTYEFRKNIMSVKNTGKIAHGQGVVVDKSKKLSQEELIPILQAEYNKQPATLIDPADKDIVKVISMASEYVEKINLVLNLTNNKNRTALANTLRDYLTNQSLLKIANAFQNDSKKTEKILRTANKNSIEIGGKKFDLESLINGKSIEELQQEKEKIVKTMLSYFETEEEKKKAKESLTNSFDISFNDEEVEIDEETERPTSLSDLEISLQIVQKFNESLEMTQEKSQENEKGINTISLDKSLDVIISDNDIAQDMEEKDKEEAERE